VSAWPSFTPGGCVQTVKRPGAVGVAVDLLGNAETISKGGVQPLPHLVVQTHREVAPGVSRLMRHHRAQPIALAHPRAHRQPKQRTARSKPIRPPANVHADEQQTIVLRMTRVVGGIGAVVKDSRRSMHTLDSENIYRQRDPGLFEQRPDPRDAAACEVVL
jgi:hypothetical protein